MEHQQQDQPNLRSLLLLGKLPKVSSHPSSVITQPTPQPKPPTQGPTQQIPASVSPATSFSTGNLAQFSSLIPALMTLKGQMIQELEEHMNRLFDLNPSRREAIAQYLDRLASQNAAPSAIEGIGDAAGGLRRWVEGPRSQAQNAALRAYFEEVAIIFLGQAILLKSWSDAGLRKFLEADIGNPNWPLSTALKSHIPVDREGWQFTRPNIYSWYRPSSAIQRQVWLTLEQTRMTDEGPGLILSIAGAARQSVTSATIPQGYDIRFFKSLWNLVPALGVDLLSDTGPIKRHRVSFSPTLRDGSLARTGPGSLNWVGMEASPFQVMVAELMQLWWGPQAPPLWAIGSGLEAHTRDQLQLALSSSKPSLLTRIADMEACDIAFVLEERIVRSQSRSSEGARFRTQLDSLPYFKKLKSAGTSLGDLQACVALSKLRPGGMMLWAREEPLSQQDGAEVLAFLLDRGKLVCEWDFSSLEHSLPVSLPLFPKYLYLFARENNVEERLSHRPRRVSLSGQIRSHIEVPVVLEDALHSSVRPGQTRGQWQIHVQVSPTPQRDWADRWPDLASQNVIRVLERLRTASVPLANVSTVRAIPTDSPVETGAQSIWIQASYDGSERRLLVNSQCDAASGGYWILIPDPSWVAPLSAYLGSSAVRDWLDHHAERKGERWVLSEQVVRWIPMPKLLLAELGHSGSQRPELPAEWERMLADVAENPKRIRATLEKLPKDDSTLGLRTSVFVQAANILENLRTGKKNLLSIVSRDGRLAWAELFAILPKSEFVPVTLHSRLTISGNLPLHLPISRIEKIKAPTHGILLATEVGMFVQITSEQLMVIDMLWEQLEHAQHPTWSELVQSLRLPRRIEMAQSTAEEILKSHAEVSARIQAFTELLSDCAVY